MSAKSAKYRVVKQSRPAFTDIDCYTVEVFRGHPEYLHWDQVGCLHGTRDAAITAAREHARRSETTSKEVVWEMWESSAALAKSEPMC